MKQYKSRQIKGLGYGRILGFPTINLEIFKDFDLGEGIYAAYLCVAGKKQRAALFFGKRETICNRELVLELYLVDGFNKEAKKWLGENRGLDFFVGKKIREVQRFDNLSDLQKAIRGDVKIVKKQLQKSDLS